MKMLRFLLCFFLLGGLSCFSGNAQTISREQAQALASEFFAQGTRATRAVTPALAYQWDSRHLSPVATIAAEEAAPAFYAFALESGEGFVIISSDANNPRVLGYSLNNSLPSVNDIPDGMRDFLTEYSMAPAQTKQSRASYDYNATSMGNIVVNLNTAPWGQGSPYNKFCTTATGGAASTGCVPTAYSILMYHHKWPVCAKNESFPHPGTGTDPITLGHEYDWVNMLHSYSGTYTNEQATAVATLMRDFGYANGVAYSAGNTGGNESATTLVKYFKYKSETPRNTGAAEAYVTGRDIVGSDATWKSYIKQSLDAGLPIPYSSSTTSGVRHVFILDGYTDADYYHFNWGWSGSGNGWFLLSDMRPDATSDYSNSHKAYFMLSPDKGEPCTITVFADCGTCGTVSASYGSTTGERISVYQGANVTLTAKPADGYLFEKWTCGTEDVSTSATCKVSAEGDAEYVAHFKEIATIFYTVDVSSAEATFGLVKIDGDAATASANKTVNHGTTVTLTAEAKDGYLFKNWTRDDEVVSIDNPWVVTVEENVSYKANFVPKQQGANITITTSTEGSGSVTINGESANTLAAKVNDEFTLAATPASGHYFVKWCVGEEVVSTKATFTTSAQASREYKAVFAALSGNIRNSIVNLPLTYGGKVEISKSGSVAQGTVVTLTATPTDANKKFAYWSVKNADGEIITNENPYTFESLVSRTYFANFVTLDTDLSVSAKATAGAGGTASVTGDMTKGGKVTFKAKANDGYCFSHWENSNAEKVSTESYYSTVVASDLTLKAVFEVSGSTGPSTPDVPTPETYNISVSVNGTNGTAAASSNSVTEGQSVTLTATPMNGYRFVNWTKGTEVVSSANPYTFVPTASGDYVANFEAIPVYNISTSVNGTNGTAAASSNSVTEGEEVTLTATANDGYRFVNWTKGTEVVSSANPYTFRPTASGEYVANFEVIPIVTPQYTISVASNDTDYGTVAVLGFGTNTSGTVDEGTTLTLVATPKANCKFVKWTCNGEDIAGGATITITADADKTYVAVFDVIIPNYSVNVSANPTNGGTATIWLGTEGSVGVTVQEGTEITLYAEAYTGYTFKNWTCGGEVVSTDATYTFTPTASGKYEANFEQDVVVEPEVPSTTPEDGKAYVIYNIHAGAKKYMLTNGYSGDEPKLPAATEGATANYSNVFICRVIDVEQNKYKCAFVNAQNGQFMVFHGKKSNNPYTDTGFQSNYDNKCELIVTPSKDQDKVGYYTISGVRERPNENGGWATMTINSDGTMDANTNVNSPSYTDNSNFSSYFTFEEVLSYPNKVNLTMISDDDELIYGLEGAIGTFSAPYATLIPENVDVYYALKSDLDGTNALHLTELNGTAMCIPAKQGVILVGAFTENTKVRMIPATSERVEAISDNAFSNTAAGSEVMQTGDYVLARGDQGIGFYQATGTLKHNKAFLRLGSASGVAAFRLVVGETTDLNCTVTIINPDAPIYDLSGRRVMQTVKGGVYIQNGKKFIVK